MNRTLKVISILLSYLLISSPSIAGELRVVRVSDGDTIKAVADHMEVVVRLVGIVERWRGGFRGPFGYLGGDGGLRNGFQDRQA